MDAVTLPEPPKLRDREAKEDGKLSEFQEELVQLAATLNGDCKKDVYPNKLVENMTVSDAAQYCHSAFDYFLKECEKAKHTGVDENQIVVCASTSLPTTTTAETRSSPRSFVQKIFSCLVCDRG